MENPMNAIVEKIVALITEEILEAEKEKRVDDIEDLTQMLLCFAPPETDGGEEE